MRNQLSQKRKEPANNIIFLAACKAHGLPEPVGEYKFHDIRGWKFDWLFGDLVALEIEGGLFGKGEPCPMCRRRPGGAHSSISGMLRDLEKYNEAAILGFVVIRVTPEQVNTGEAFALIKRALEAQ